MAGRLGCDHPYVDAFGRHDLLEMNIETMSPDQGFAGRDLVSNVVFENAPLSFIWNEHDDDIGLAGRIGDIGDLQPSLFGSCP